MQQVMVKFLDCGDLRAGFARLKCLDYGGEFLLEFSCKCRHFCPSYHQKRANEFGDWFCFHPHLHRYNTDCQLPVFEDDYSQLPSLSWEYRTISWLNLFPDRETLFRPKQKVSKAVRRWRSKTFFIACFEALFIEFSGRPGSNNWRSATVLPARKYDDYEHLFERNRATKLGFNQSFRGSFRLEIEGRPEKIFLPSSSKGDIDSTKKTADLKPAVFKGLFGGAKEDRTPDLMTASHALSQLSYSPSYKLFIIVQISYLSNYFD